MKFVKGILDNCGFSNIWDTQFYINETWLKKSVQLRLQDQYKQVWSTTVHESSKSVNYRIFKEIFEFEKYFDILDRNDCITLCKFRTSNHKLPIEVGIWYDIDRSDRLCHLCDTESIGDEFHYLLECKSLNDTRKRLLDKFYCSRINTVKFQKLMNIKHRPKLRKLCQFIKFINKSVCPPG